ncbi:hypothetical protein AJ80_05641 [Polytolypa hystricis UAMH7299]|uniref:Uncharacterized protein n=1 Tax=Polytolypa hystricis (strain UAMH7299) TaxID=1447883 RepID=A0A2B7Y373_POLH7|nr:hypothetical protein AJ80_05641 [Polytolypa hystricis UAMH7299]
MSKLSCLGCWTTINAWNKTHDAPRYVVRGTHGKWYFPWAVPTRIAKDDPAEEVVNCLKQHNLCRLRSDSSVESAHSQWTSLNDEQLTKESKKKRIATMLGMKFDRQ